jgi:hypothetical protein
MATLSRKRIHPDPGTPQLEEDEFEGLRAREVDGQVAVMTPQFREYCDKSVALYNSSQLALTNKLNKIDPDLLYKPDLAKRLKELQPPIHEVDEFLRLRGNLVREFSAFLKDAGSGRGCLGGV